MFTNPTIPNLADYLSFLNDVVGIPLAVFPQVFGQATGGDTTLLQDTNQLWDPHQWKGYYVVDSTLGQSSSISDSDVVTVTFATPFTQIVQFGDNYTIMPGIVPTSFAISKSIVNASLNAMPDLYTLAVYNLAADRLINYASDIPTQNYFKQARIDYGITSAALGVISASSDEATSSTWMNPEQLKTLTLMDLQNLKTPYGREYLGLAQMYGTNLWGLS